MNGRADADSSLVDFFRTVTKRTEGFCDKIIHARKTEVYEDMYYLLCQSPLDSVVRHYE